MNTFELKTKIISGINSCQSFNFRIYKNVLLVTDQIMMKIGLVDSLTSSLETQKVSYKIYPDVEPNPSFDTVSQGVSILLSQDFDAILALGGGSVVDAAKGILYYAAQVQNERNITFVKPDLIAVPTTSGAGSEVTAYAVITNIQEKIKVPIVSDLIIPDMAILDPVFTQTCPSKVTAESGIDVLTHILESYVAKNSNTITESLCEKVISIIFKNLSTVVHNGNNLEARLAMHEASCMAGIAFTNSGLGLNHAMSHSLGGRFHIPHGRANALLMPHIIKYNQRVVASKYALLTRILDLPATNNQEAVMSLLVAIEYLCQNIKLERSVLEFGVDRTEYLNAIPEMARLAHADPCLTTNPIPISVSEIEEIYKVLL
ncbi:MAG: 1-propanol dehydrogenase PduQ [Brevinemataceae bacterium]